MNIIKIIYITIFTILISSIDCYAQKPRKIFSHIQENNLNLAVEEYAKIKSDKVYDTDEKILFEIADCIFLINKSYPKYNPILSIKYFNNIYNNLDNYFNTPKSKKEIHKFLAKYDLTFDTIANRIHSEIAFEAKKINTVESYDKALEVCSDKFRFELKQLKEEAFYKQTINEGTISAYKTFILNYSNSKHVIEIQVLLERKVLDNAKSNQSVDDLNSFIVEYATSNLKQEATDCRDSIVLSKVLNTYDSMLAFTKEYPNSKYLKGVESKLPDLLYNEAVLANTFESLSRFIKEFPQDARIKNVNKKISELPFTEISINKINNLVVSCDNDNDYRFLSFTDGMAAVILNGKYGYIDTSGKVAIELKYDYNHQFTDFHQGIVSISVDGKYGLIDKNGNEVTPLKYDDIFFDDNRVSDLDGIKFIIVKYKNKFGFIDRKGREICKIKYDRVNEFSDGLALVSINGKIDFISNDGVDTVYHEFVGFINELGEEIIPLKYNKADDFKYGLAVVGMDNYYGHVDVYGKQIMTTKYGFINNLGKIVVPLKYDGARLYDEFGDVRIDKQSKNPPYFNFNFKHGIIDKKGKEITPIKYDDISAHDNGFTWVTLNGKRGLVDKNGQEITPIKYDDGLGAWFSDGLAPVKLNEKYGFVNEKGIEVIPLKYDWVDHFFNGFACVRLNGKYGFINKFGIEITPLKYDYQSTFSNGFASVRLNGKWGFIDENGVETISLKYDFAGNFYNGMADVSLNGKWGFINKSEIIIIPFEYEYLNTSYLWLSNGFVIAKKKCEYFIIRLNYKH